MLRLWLSRDEEERRNCLGITGCIHIISVRSIAHPKWIFFTHFSRTSQCLLLSNYDVSGESRITTVSNRDRQTIPPIFGNSNRRLSPFRSCDIHIFSNHINGAGCDTRCAIAQYTGFPFFQYFATSKSPILFSVPATYTSSPTTTISLPAPPAIPGPRRTGVLFFQ